MVDLLVAVLILGIGTVSAISTLLSANRTAEANRARNAAQALCQERIDQTFGMAFAPPAVIPSYFGATWPLPATDVVTSTETVPVKVTTDGTTALSGTRLTLVSLADADLDLVRVTARVTFTYRGTTYMCQSSTLRSPD